MSEQVYFARSGDKIKVGFSTDVPARMATLRTSSAEPIEVIAVVDGDMGLEAAIHARLKPFHVAREWFRDCDEVRTILGEIVEHGTAAVADLYQSKPPRRSRREEPFVPAPSYHMSEDVHERYMETGNRMCRIAKFIKRQRPDGSNLQRRSKELVSAAIGEVRECLQEIHHSDAAVTAELDRADGVIDRLEDALARLPRELALVSLEMG